MSLLYKAVDDITIEDVQRLITNGVVESRRLDYKQALPDLDAKDGNARDERRNLLYDIAAMTNGGGGELLYGVEEERLDNKPSGRPQSTTGIVTDNVDALTRKIENLMLDGIKPRVVGFRLKPLLVEDNGYVILIRMPRSLNAPHLVALGGTQRFYTRDAGGNHIMDVDELRASFLATAGFMERAEAWRAARLEDLPGVDGATRVVLHLVPLSLDYTGNSLEARRLEAQRDNLVPLTTGQRRIGAIDIQHRFDAKGFRTYLKHSNERPPYTQVQFFRNGSIEAVDTGLLRDKRIHSAEFEKVIIESTQRYLSAMRGAGVQPPILVAISLRYVLGYVMGVTSALIAPIGTGPVEENALDLPAVLLDDWETSVGRLLRPTFDTVWNACGWPESPNYDEHGNWRAYQGAYMIE